MREVKDDGYKYLGVLETDQIKHDDMKDKVKIEYLRRVRRTAVIAEQRQQDRCHQHMGCVSSVLHSWDYQLEER